MVNPNPAPVPEESDAQRAFLEQARREGYIPFSHANSCLGAANTSGRSAEILPHNSGRQWQVVLGIEGSTEILFVIDEFEHAADLAFRWLGGESPDDAKRNVRAYIRRNGTRRASDKLQSLFQRQILTPSELAAQWLDLIVSDADDETEFAVLWRSLSFAAKSEVVRFLRHLEESGFAFEPARLGPHRPVDSPERRERIRKILEWTEPDTNRTEPE
jgi:hypothetical protein